MRKDFFMKNLLAASMLLAVSMGMVSCQGLVDAIVGTSDNPSTQPSQPSTQPTETVVTPTAQGAKVEASSPEAVSEALASLVDDIKAKGVGDGKEYKVEVSTKDISTSASDCTIEVPKVTGSNINIVFDDGVSTGSTPLVVKAAETASTTPTEAVNELTITVPDAQALDLSVDMPETTVTLKSSGSNTVFKSIVAKTAVNTLYIESGVTVEELQVLGGRVIVKEGGKIETYVYAPDGHILEIFKDGLEPIWVQAFDEAGNETYLKQVSDENGNPYYFKNLKIVKGTQDYAIFENNGSKMMKKLTICDGAAVNCKNTPYFTFETIEGQGNARILYGIWYNDFETDEPLYFGKVNFSNVKSMSGVAVSALWADKLDKYEMKITGLPASMTDCSFKGTKIQAERQKGANAISAKNCKFESYADKEAYLSVYSIEPNDGVSSFKATFDNCEFVENTFFDFLQGAGYKEVQVYFWTKIVDGAIFPDGPSTSFADVPEANKEVGETKDKYDTSKNPVEGYPMSMGYWRETQKTPALPVDNFDFTAAFNGCKYGSGALTATTPIEIMLSGVQGLNYFVEIDGTKYTPSTKWDEATGKSYWNLTKVE